MKFILPVEAIRERDIDFILLEEFTCSEEFRIWFKDNVIGSEYDVGEYRQALHSVVDSKMGESDLLLKYCGKDNKGFLILIEVKIDAKFQEKQDERYHQRGEAAKQRGECGDYLTVLIAPENYLNCDHNFDEALSLESIQTFFKKNVYSDNRYEFKSKMLDIAIERLRRGYKGIRDEEATQFWHSYYKFAQKYAPELNMVPPLPDVPRHSGFHRFRPVELPKGMTLYHKTRHSNIDLEFSNMGPKEEEIRKIYNDKLTAEMEIVRTHKSVVVRIKVDKIDILKKFEEQKDKVIMALDKLKVLHKWMTENVDRTP